MQGGGPGTNGVSISCAGASGPHAVVMRRMFSGPHGWALRAMGTVAAGAIGWALDVAILWTLAIGIGVATPIAAACGLTASGSVNFLINRAVYGGGQPRRDGEFTRYAGLFAVNLVLVAVSVPLIAELLDGIWGNRGVELIAAKVVVTGVLLLFNSYAYHRWVFNRAVDAPPGAQ